MVSDTKTKPLAERIRPKIIDDFLGQEEILGKGKLLRLAIESDQLPSMILWGPPGSGKTTLARIVSEKTSNEFLQISAVTSGLKELRQIIKKSKENTDFYNKKTILFIDEIHRWNKAQQDALLPLVEKGVVTLIGATTENPSFEIRSALLSRCRVFVLSQLNETQIIEIIMRAIKDEKDGLGRLNLKIDKEVVEAISQMSNGDARTALNILEYASSLNSKITLDTIKEAFQKTNLIYDKNGEEHYNIISALHKSMRGSDADASMYWLGRMLEAGEDPLYIARRLVRFASEDIGLANSRALEQAVAAYQACHFIGMPECSVILSQAVVYMAKCKKSNNLYKAYRKVTEEIQSLGNLPVPLHLRNAPTKLMKTLGYGDGYKYSPDYNYKDKQEFLPDKLRGKKFLS